MYSISRLSREALSFVSNSMAAAKTRNLPFSIAAAHVLSSACSLPSGDVKDIPIYFNTNHSVQIDGLLGQLIEFCPINSKAIKLYVKAFYAQRCEAISPRAIPLMLREGKGIVDMFGLNLNFPEEVLEEINLRPTEIMNSIAGISLVLSELRKGNEEQTSTELSGNTYAA